MPLLVVSLLYLSLVLVEVMPGVELGPALMLLDGAFWFVFVIDYVWRVFFLAPDRWAYAQEPLCLLDLVVVASFPALLVLGSGFLGFARAARVAAQVLRMVRGGAQAARTLGQAHSVFSRRSLRWVLPLALLVIVFAALFVWRFEEAHHNGNMATLGETAWWAITSLTTGGESEGVPHSTEGRVAGAVLMIVGIVIIGWLTAALASLFVESDEAAPEVTLHQKLEEISHRLALIEARLSETPAPEEDPAAGD